jgi:hypothetical protein
MPSFRASAIPLSAFIAAAALTGCSSMMDLAAEPPPGVHLAGDWKLDPARSDDLGKAVAELRAQLAKAHHANRSGTQQQGFGGFGGHRRGGGPGQQGGQGGQQTGQDESSTGADSGGQGVGIGGGAGPRNSPVDELMSNVPRGDYLKLKMSSDAFTVISGDSTDEYTSGLESEISAEQGDAEQISGWKKTAYIIDTKPQFGAEIIQTFALTKDGRLMMTVQLKGSGIKLIFNRVYDRTTQVAPLAPPTNN